MVTQYAHASWTDFRAGVPGATDPLPGVATQSYICDNMQVYRSGGLGPRPVWRLLSEITGSHKPVSPDKASIIYWNNNVVIVRNSAIDFLSWFDLDSYTFGSNLIVGYGPFHSMPVHVSPLGDNSYYVLSGKYIESQPSGSISPNPQYLSSLPGGVTGKIGAVYRDRCYIADLDDPAQIGRVYYSDPGDWFSYQAENYFDDASPSVVDIPIKGMWPLLNGLILCNVVGDWWALSGADPVQGSLRFLGNSVIPVDFNYAVVYKDRVLFHAPDMRCGIVAVGTTGIDTTTLVDVRLGMDILDRNQSVLPMRALRSNRYDSLFLPYSGPYSAFSIDNNSVEYVNGAWCYSSVANLDEADWLDYTTDGQYIYALVHHPSDDTYWLMRRSVMEERPDPQFDELSPWNPADTTPTNPGTIILDRVVHPQHYGIRPRYIQFSIRQWKQFFDNRPFGFRVIVNQLTTSGPLEILNESVDTSDWYNYTSGYEGTGCEPTITIDQVPFEPNFQIRIEDIHGVVFDRVTVSYEIDVNRPRY